MKFRTENKSVEISPLAEKMIYAGMKEAHPDEFIGYLLGRKNGNWIKIDSIYVPKKSIATGNYCEIKTGLENLLKDILSDRILGDIHSHLGGRISPSLIDRRDMLSNKNYVYLITSFADEIKKEGFNAILGNFFYFKNNRLRAKKIKF